MSDTNNPTRKKCGLTLIGTLPSIGSKPTTSLYKWMPCVLVSVIPPLACGLRLLSAVRLRPFVVALSEDISAPRLRAAHSQACRFFRKQPSTLDSERQTPRSQEGEPMTARNQAMFKQMTNGSSKQTATK